MSSITDIKSKSILAQRPAIGIAILLTILAAVLGIVNGWLGYLFSDFVSLLMVCGLLIGAAALVLTQRLGLVVLMVVVYAPFELFIFKWLPGSLGLASRFVTEGVLAGFLIIIFIDTIFGNRTWKRTPLDGPLLLFVGAGILSAWLNETPPLAAILGLRILLRYTLLFYLIVQLGFNFKGTRRLIVAVLVAAAVVMLIGLAQAVIGPPLTNILRVTEIEINENLTREISGFFNVRGRFIFSTLGRYDALGVYAVIILLLAAALYIHFPRWRGRLIGLIVITAVCLVLTLSRQSWVALYGALWVWALLSRRRWAIGLLAGLLVTVIAGVSVLALLSTLAYQVSHEDFQQGSLLTRILVVFSDRYIDISATRAGRLFVLQMVSKRILELSPWWGFGPGNFGSITATYFGISNADLLGMQPRDVILLNDVNWVTILGQYGLMGTAAFLLMFLTMGRYSWISYNRAANPLTRSLALTCIGSITVILILGFFGPNFEQRVISMYVWLIAGLTVALTRAEKQSPPANIVRSG